MSDIRPQDVHEQLFGEKKNLPARKQDVKNITRTSEKLDGSVHTIEEKVNYWQEMLNNWRVSIMQNEQVIIIFCIFFGILYSYAINECTGNLNLPAYVYVLVLVIVFLMSLLLIAEGSLPLVVIMKFIVSVAVGHVSMMWMIAIDGHTWHIFTTDVCRYPVTTDSIMILIVGTGIGYIWKSFEEIKEKGRQ